MNRQVYKLGVVAFLLGLSSSAFAQNVGINTETPQVTLDVVGKPSDAAKADGLLAPRVTGAELAAKDNVYGAAQKGALVFVTEGIAGDRTTKTANVDAVGYYYFDGSIWVKVGGNSGQAPIVYTAGTGIAISPSNQISRQTPWNIWKTGNTSTAVTDNIYQNGKVSLGTDFSGSTIADADVAQLQIAGGGQQQIGLFSDANGSSKMYIGHEPGQGLTVSVGGDKARKMFLKYDGTFYLGNITAADQSGTGHSLAYSSTEKRLYLKGESTDNISLQTSKGIKVEQFAGAGDRPVYADPNGVLKLGTAYTAGTGISINNGQISRQTPWNIAATTNTATTVDNSIYQKGRVGIGDFSSSNIGGQLEVLGGGTSQLRISRNTTQDKWDISSESGVLTFTSRFNETGAGTDTRLFGLSHNGKVSIGYPLYDANGTGATFIYDSVIQKLTLRGGGDTNNISLETTKRVKVGELPNAEAGDSIVYAAADGTLRKGAGANTNIYTNNGNITEAREVNIAANRLHFKTSGEGKVVIGGDTNNITGDNAYELAVNGDTRISGELNTKKGIVGDGSADASFRVNIPTKGDGKVLVSDANGNATWQNPEDRFYLPAVTLDTSSTGTKTVDLYAIYNMQYGSPIASSPNTTGRVPLKKYTNATQLDYYVTYADTAVFNNISIDANGVMTYNVITTTTSPRTFMNIVLVGKR